MKREQRGEYFELFTCTKSYTNIRLYETLGYRQEEVVEKGELSIVYMRKEKERKERTILIVNDDGIAAEGINYGYNNCNLPQNPLYC